MALSPATRTDLLELFATVRRDASAGDLGNSGEYGVTRYGQTLVFEGRSAELLRKIVDQLQNSAYISGGPGPANVRELLFDACFDAASLGGEAAIAALLEKLDAPERLWAIGAPIHVVNLPATPFVVGSCTIAEYPPHYHRLFSTIEQWYRFKDLVISTTVEARDLESAVARAYDEFDAAQAILGLVSKIQRSMPEVLWKDEDDKAGLSRWQQRTEVFRVELDGGQLPPGFRELKTASVTEESHRLEWEHRCVAGCRWYHRARRSTSPSAALVMCMTALECLCVAGRQEPSKGKVIASRVAEIFPDADKPLTSWLADLYRHRNAAAHEGISYLDEIELRYLLDLTRSLILWGVRHLDPEHRSPAGSCVTFADAYNSELHRQAG